jgi:hypothetical protein
MTNIKTMGVNYVTFLKYSVTIRSANRLTFIF